MDASLEYLGALLLQVLRRQDELDANIRRLSDDICELRLENQKRERPKRRVGEPGARITEDDRAKMDAVLPEISGCIGDHRLSVAEMRMEQGLKDAMRPLQGMSNKAVGRLFARAQGVQFGDYSIHGNHDAREDLQIWHVKCCPQRQINRNQTGKADVDDRETESAAYIEF